ncbi:MAG: hypothetical protein ACI9OH_002325 [Oleispira sp.]|jgi:hypothetical protein
MHLFIVLLLSSLFSFSAYSETTAWELEKEEKDINLKIFTREIAGSNLKEFKGEMLVKTEMTTIAALLLDGQAAPQWMHQCEKFEVVEQIDELTAIVYFINGAPWPASDRDAVVMTAMSQDPESLVLKAELNVINDRLPEDDDYVRIPHMKGFWLFEPKDEGQILVTYQVHANPGGSLPNWLANSVVVDTPYYTMSNMLDMLKLKKYQKAGVLSIKNVQ